MLRIGSGALVAALVVLAAAPVDAGTVHKRHGKYVWHGYGFLPGYRPPQRLQTEGPSPRDTGHYFWGDPGYNFYGGPGVYRGRWNGGGFGPCYTRTPIGPVWNCG